MLNTRFLTLVCITSVTAAAARLILHPPNFTPLFAMALFGGAYFANRRVAFAVPVVALFLSDLLLGAVLYGFQVFLLWPYVYSCFVLTVGLGLWVRQKKSAFRIGVAALASAGLFFLISNFGSWRYFYPQTWEGLVACYLAGLDLLANNVAGNALYAVLLFGGFALAQRFFPVLREASVEIQPARQVA